MGATQKSHSCCKAQPPTKSAGPVLRAGFTEVLVPGEIEGRIEEERSNTGLPVSEEVWKDLTALSKTYNEPLEV